MDMHTSATPPVNGSVSPTPEGHNSPVEPHHNGDVVQADAHAGTASEQSPNCSTARAEVLVDQLGNNMARVAALVTTNLKSFTAHVREAFEDFWAETQNVRHGKRS